MLKNVKHVIMSQVQGDTDDEWEEAVSLAVYDDRAVAEDHLKQIEDVPGKDPNHAFWIVDLPLNPDVSDLLATVRQDPWLEDDESEEDDGDDVGGDF